MNPYLGLMKAPKNINFPKISFGIIVLNGEPFTRYCLRSIYEFAYEIIVVEGGHEDAKSVCTPDGHSIDSTLDSLYSFKKDEDPENKLTIVTRDGFWPKKDELGRSRTPQSRAYAERATGNYLWQIDIDEFYRKEDMEYIINLLRSTPDITAVTFPTYTFWGGINYISDSWALRRGSEFYNRLFKWSSNYKYLTHEPPTVVDEKGINLRQKHWITGKEMKNKNIYMYHYSLLFPWQVEQKVRVYKDEKPDACSEIINWAENNYFKLGNPYRVHNLYHFPGWLERFNGSHPDQVVRMIKDIEEGRTIIELRKTDDIEELLSSKKYGLGIILLKIANPFDRLLNQLLRVRNIPKKIRQLMNKNRSK